MDENKNAVEIFNRRAEGYRDKFMNVDLYADGFDLFLSSLPQRAEVLELACGPGNITKYLLAKRPDLKILATDLAPNMLKIAKEEKPGAELQLLDCRNILSLNRKFQGILAGFCFPYLSENECAQLIKDSSQLLYKGGVLYISTMEADEQNASGIKTSSYGDKMYMYYHRADPLLKELENNGFRLLSQDRKITVSSSGDRVTDLILIAGK